MFNKRDLIGTLFETLWLEKVNYSENDFTNFRST